jgi:hypothetical protein
MKSHDVISIRRGVRLTADPSMVKTPFENERGWKAEI